jgi:hypothetical protein
MAKATRKSTSGPLPLSEARELACTKYLSREQAEKRVFEFLEQGGPDDWQYQGTNNAEPGQDFSDFWRSDPKIGRSHPEVTWKNNSALRYVVHDKEVVLIPVTLYGVTIAATARKKFLQFLGLLRVTDEWLLAKREEIIQGPGHHTLRSLAEKIRPLMVEAVKSGVNIDLLEEGTIRNKLSVLLSRPSKQQS